VDTSLVSLQEMQTYIDDCADLMAFTYINAQDVNFGVGNKLVSGLNFGARYILGLSDVNDNPDSPGDSSFKNSVIRAYVGFFFRSLK